MKIKRVEKATPEYATSETVVCWDMDTCPLPNGFDPRLLAPRIDTELKDLGYSGPLTIVACGNLHGIPFEFLRTLSSTGVLIRNSIRGLYDMVTEYLDSRTSQSPMSIMLITTDSCLLDDVICQIYKGVCVGYNLLLAYPSYYKIGIPHPSSLVYIGGEWLWTRYSLLKVSGADKTRGLVDTGGFQKFSCESCLVPSFGSFEDFTEHMETSRIHIASVQDSDFTVKMIMERDAEGFEMLKQSEEYNELLESKKVYFEDRYNRYYNLEMAEMEKAQKAQMEKADMEKAEMEKAEMEKAEIEISEMEIAEMEIAEMEKAEMEIAEMEKAEIEISEMEKAEIEISEMEKAEIEKAGIEKAGMEKAETLPAFT